VPAIKQASISSRNITKSIAKFASDKKAEDIVVLDMRKLINFCDYFVICSGTSDRHVGAIADHIEEELSKRGHRIKATLGMRKSNWIVFDTGDVVTHIFQKQVREFYNLEGLWQEAKAINWE